MLADAAPCMGGGLLRLHCDDLPHRLSGGRRRRDAAISVPAIRRCSLHSQVMSFAVAGQLLNVCCQRGTYSLRSSEVAVNGALRCARARLAPVAVLLVLPHG